MNTKAKAALFLALILSQGLSFVIAAKICEPSELTATGLTCPECKKYTSNCNYSAPSGYNSWCAFWDNGENCYTITDGPDKNSACRDGGAPDSTCTDPTDEWNVPCVSARTGVCGGTTSAGTGGSGWSWSCEFSSGPEVTWGTRFMAAGTLCPGETGGQ
jgi:hypothetical protein